MSRLDTLEARSYATNRQVFDPTYGSERSGADGAGVEWRSVRAVSITVTLISQNVQNVECNELCVE